MNCKRGPRNSWYFGEVDKPLIFKPRKSKKLLFELLFQWVDLNRKILFEKKTISTLKKRIYSLRKVTKRKENYFDQPQKSRFQNHKFWNWKKLRIPCSQLLVKLIGILCIVVKYLLCSFSHELISKACVNLFTLTLWVLWISSWPKSHERHNELLKFANLIASFVNIQSSWIFYLHRRTVISDNLDLLD